MHGHGIFNWWGFSPAADLLNYALQNDETSRVLMIGAGDPRHLLKMFVGGKKKRKLKVYVLESQVELYSRMILLLGVCLQRGFGLKERATLLLDLWGNLTLRPTSKDYLEGAARAYAMSITDDTQYEHLVGMVSAAKLKYRERDAMDDVFKSWYKLTTPQYHPTVAWDVRLRQLFKTRYDNRRAEADLAWHLRLSFRLEHLLSPPEENSNKASSKASKGQKINLDGYVGVASGWGKEFLEWRQTGQAFDVCMQSKSDLPNTSLASVAMVSDGMQRHRRVGYWGDLLTGPFPALSLASTNDDLIKLQNGRSKYNGTEVAQWNLEDLLESLWKSPHQVEAGKEKAEAQKQDHASKESKTTTEPEVHCQGERNNGIQVKETGVKITDELLNDGENVAQEENDEFHSKEIRQTTDRCKQESQDQNCEMTERGNHIMLKEEKLKLNTKTESIININLKEKHKEMKLTEERKLEVDSNSDLQNSKDDLMKTKPEMVKRKTVENALLDEIKTDKTTQDANNELHNQHTETIREIPPKLSKLNKHCQKDLNTKETCSNDGSDSQKEIPLAEKGNPVCTSNSSNISMDENNDHQISDKSEAFSGSAETSEKLGIGKEEKQNGEPDESRFFGEPLANGGIRKEEQKSTSDNDYMQLEGVEVILLSPTRLSDLQCLPEVSGCVDVVYLSAAMAHLLTPKLARNHLAPHTTLLIETARMMPELTDAQVSEYEERVTSSADEAGWIPSVPAPICHLRFNRTTNTD